MSLIETSRQRIEAEENIVIDFQYALMDALNERGLTRDDLAQLLGVSKARISQWLSDEANPTLKTVARVFHALDLKVPFAPRSVWEPKHMTETFATRHERGFDQIEQHWNPFCTVWVQDEIGYTNDNLSEREKIAA